MKIESIAQEHETPIYVYEKNQINRNYQKIKGSLGYKNSEILFALMCNNNLEVLKIIRDLGLKVQLNSENEIDLARDIGFDFSEMSFTSTGLSERLIKKIIDNDIEVNFDSVEEVEKFCHSVKNKGFGIRIAVPYEMKSSLINATNVSPDSHTGISLEDLDKVKRIAKESGNKVVGVHGYLASNVLESEPFIGFGDFLVDNASEFPDLEYVNFGSGFGVKSQKGEEEFDFEKVLQYYSNLMEGLSEKLGRSIKLKVEPGRSILASAGVLLAKVTNVKKIDDEKLEVFIDAGFGEFARPRIYGAYHEIENVGDSDKPIKIYNVRGNSVLQSDFLGKNRKLKEVKEGDFLVIKNTGAYGIVMASGFPGKKLPKEIVVE